jgi:hypothetical protein
MKCYDVEHKENGEIKTDIKTDRKTDLQNEIGRERSWNRENRKVNGKIKWEEKEGGIVGRTPPHLMICL